MSFKKLHSFVVNIEKDVDKLDVRQENGQEITVKSKVKEQVPHTIVMKTPTRREKQSLSVFYTVSYNEALALGLMPKLRMVQKFLKDPDSALSQDEDKNIEFLYKRMDTLRNDHMRLGVLEDTDETKKRKEEIISEFLTIQKKVTDIETSYRSLFAHTAENYAQNKAITWLVLHLTHTQDKDAEPKPMFPGDSYDKKEQSLFDLEEAEDKLYYGAVDRLSMYYSLYFMDRASNPEDFSKIEDEYNRQIQADKEIAEMEKKAAEDLAKKNTSEVILEVTPKAVDSNEIPVSQ